MNTSDPEDNRTAEDCIREAQAALDARKYGVALAAADAAIAIESEYALAWLVRAQALRALQRSSDAAQAFEKVLAAAPGLAGVRVNLANTYAELDRLSDAERELKAAIALKPDLAAAHASLGSIYARMERPDLAIAPSRAALALDADLIPAHENLAGLLARSDPSAAKVHRDAAYRRQQVFVEGLQASRTLLVLQSAEGGNVPYQHILPRNRYNLVKWYIAYAPEGQAERLPPYDLVFNAVGDADGSAETQAAAAAFVTGVARPLINDPVRVAQTLRSAMPKLLGDIAGLLVPAVLRHTRTEGDLTGTVMRSGVPFPVIVRPAGFHGGDGMRRFFTPAALAASELPAEIVYVTAYVDYRSADGWYRKYRMIFVDREPYPYHLAISSDWIVHYHSARMAEDATRRDEEARFLSDPETALGAQAMRAIRAIAKRLDLDYGGIDFSILPDGRVLFFEANATMLVHPEKDPIFAYKNRAAHNIIDAVSAMIEKRIAAHRD